MILLGVLLLTVGAGGLIINAAAWLDAHRAGRLTERLRRSSCVSSLHGFGRLAFNGASLRNIAEHPKVRPVGIGRLKNAEQCA